MACCLLALVAMFPRGALVVMWLGGYGGRAFDTLLFPLLGFFVMPYEAKLRLSPAALGRTQRAKQSFAKLLLRNSRAPTPSA